MVIATPLEQQVGFDAASQCKAAADAPGVKHCSADSALNDFSVWRRGAPVIPATVFMVCAISAGAHHQTGALFNSDAGQWQTVRQ